MSEKNCFYCGNKCNKLFNKKEYVKKTFTNYDIVKYPISNYICDDCVWAFGSDSKIIMIDKEIRSGNPRNYSWYITNNKKIAYTKKHIKELRELLLNIPEIPFKIVLSDSGQKHLLFRADFNFEKDNYIIQLEEEKILININKLKEYLYLADRLSAAIGKVAILDCEKISYIITIEKYYEDLTDYENWLKIYKKPMAKVAAWLSKNKEEASNEYKSINTRTI